MSVENSVQRLKTNPYLTVVVIIIMQDEKGTCEDGTPYPDIRNSFNLKRRELFYALRIVGAKTINNSSTNRYCDFQYSLLAYGTVHPVYAHAICTQYLYRRTRSSRYRMYSKHMPRLKKSGAKKRCLRVSLSRRNHRGTRTIKIIVIIKKEKEKNIKKFSPPPTSL